MSTLASTAYPTQDVETEIDVYQEPREIPLWEQAGATLWLLVTYIELPMGGPLRYLLLAGIIAYAAFNFATVSQMFLKAWPILLLPIFGAFSFMWADYPSAAMRQGIFYFLTVFVPIVFAARLNLRILLRCYFFAAAIAVIWGLQWFGDYARGGPYGSKNYLALHMTFAAFFFITRVLDKNEHTPIRLLGAALLPISLLMIYQANSSTALVMCIGGVAGLILVRLVWLNLASMAHMKTILIMSFAGLVALVALVIANLSANSFVADGLDMLGKDATLTGRTTMWSVGEVVAAERPMFGVGLGSFWQYDVGAAQTINENDFKPIGTQLTFHNSYLEVRVHLGYIGYYLYVLTLFWVGYNVVRNWLKSTSVETSAVFVITAIAISWSFTESWLWQPLNGAAMLFFIGALAAVSNEQTRYLGKAKARIANS